MDPGDSDSPVANQLSETPNTKEVYKKGKGSECVKWNDDRNKGRSIGLPCYPWSLRKFRCREKSYRIVSNKI